MPGDDRWSIPSKKKASTAHRMKTYSELQFEAQPAACNDHK